MYVYIYIYIYVCMYIYISIYIGHIDHAPVFSTPHLTNVFSIHIYIGHIDHAPDLWQGVRLRN